jgi:hypothetical protein
LNWLGLLLKYRGAVALAGVLFLAVPTHSQAQFDEAINRGVQFLKGRTTQSTMGPTALATMAMIKSTGNPDDPAIAPLVSYVRSAVQTEGYRPAIGSGDIYEAAVVLMTLSSAGSDKHIREIEAVAKFLMSRQSENGSWDYATGGSGDTSQSQYAILALWEAAAAGIEIPIKVWDRALHWLITRQDPSGGFCYHPADPGGETPIPQSNVTHSMSVAGAGSIIICRSQLPFKDLTTDPTQRPLLIPVQEQLENVYRTTVTQQQADAATERSRRWMESHYTVSEPSGPHLYYLYGLERYTSLANLKALAGRDWYTEGARYLVSKQQADGSWTSNYDATVDTSFAILFLGRSTEKTITRIQITRVGRGTMIGGRGLPDPSGMPSGISARRMARYSKALRAPVEDLLATLDNPEDENVEGAAIALETVDHNELIRAVGNDRQKLRRLTRNDRPEVRQAAVAALARTKDLRAAPVLIERLTDPDPEVYRAARDGLRYLSRRMDAFGMPETPPDAKALAAGIKSWQEWFASLKIAVDPKQEFDD